MFLGWVVGVWVECWGGRLSAKVAAQVRAGGGQHSPWCLGRFQTETNIGKVIENVFGDDWSGRPNTRIGRPSTRSTLAI